MSILEIIEEWALEMGYKYFDEDIAELVARVEGFVDDQFVPVAEDDDFIY